MPIFERPTNLQEFRRLVSTETNLADYPCASRIESRAVVYNCADVRAAVAAGRADVVRSELVQALLDGPGLVVLEGAFDQPEVVDRASAAFLAMIADQHARGAVVGDHYAKPGANDRVWNVIEKFAVDWPEAFVDYYANDIVALVASAWLGPGYQISSQVNVVNPGGQAQEPHCDYHLGFLSNAVAAEFPPHVHQLSPVLTLQGAVAHCDMPVESGPTMYLPYSQRYPYAYLSWRDEGHRDVFREFVVQLSLAKGDVAFFNPRMFHAAGENRTTDIRRMANLLQISSAFGRAMETMDRERMCNAVYPALLARIDAGLDNTSVRNIIAATAEWYPFPTNLDHDPPVGGLAPPSQADVLTDAVRERWTAQRLADSLSAHSDRRKSI